MRRGEGHPHSRRFAVRGIQAESLEVEESVERLIRIACSSSLHKFVLLRSCMLVHPITDVTGSTPPATWKEDLLANLVGVRIPPDVLEAATAGSKVTGVPLAGGEVVGAC